jgi:tRNA 5-methylaminomethyl-2-thiouridine biosynthesis bifunctional protein
VPPEPPPRSSGCPAPELCWDEARQVPVSARFQDLYHSATGALAQARHVFMGGCELPQRWQGRSAFTILETGFGLGLNFLATWQAWLDDPARCERLHFVSIEAYPVTAQQLLDCVMRSAELKPLRALAQALASRYPSSRRPGLHRLRFAHPTQPRQVLTLTLALGEASQLLPRLRCQADAAYLDGFSPAKNPELWQARIFKAVARLLKPQALAATWSVAAVVRKGLREAGFEVSRRPGLPPKRDALQALYRPWAMRATAATTTAPAMAAEPAAPQHSATASDHDAAPDAVGLRRALVIGAGLAGVASCWSLSQRGWQVSLIDAGPGPASGASGLPVGLAVPHLSPDDAVVSRLTRSGCHWMRQLLEDMAAPPQAWRERRVWQVLDAASAALPEDAADTPALGGQECAELAGGYRGPAVAHEEGLSIKGGELLAHWLTQCPSLQCHWQRRVARLQRSAEPASQWQALDEQGQLIDQAAVVILATAMTAPGLIPAAGKMAETEASCNAGVLTPLRGQITLGHWPDEPHFGTAARSALPGLTGHGHFIANWSPSTAPHTAPDWDWSMGSSFERNDSDCTPRLTSDQENLRKLEQLAPELARLLAPQFGAEQRPKGVQPWVEVRATTADRLPMAGALPDWQRARHASAAESGKPVNAAWTLDRLPRLPGLYMLCGLGARGLSLAALCAELLASQIEGEPWPLEATLAQAMDPARFDLKRLRQSAPAAAATA